jgi:transcription antitermination factor NusG
VENSTELLPVLKRDKEAIKVHWFVFYVKAKHERQVERLLLRDGYTVYLPLITSLKQWAQRKKMVEESLFKSYIFVQIRKNQIYDVLQLPSVVKSVRFNNEPAVLLPKHIELIKELILNKTQFEVSNDLPKTGETVTLKSGPFKGQKGVVKEIRGKRKILILLESIGFSLEIEL